MANKDRPKGFEPLGMIMKSVNAESGSEIFGGDWVALASDGLVDTAAAGVDLYGLSMEYVAAAAVELNISVGSDQEYIGQASGADINLQTDIGNLVNILATAGNAGFKHSRQEIDSSTIGTGSGGQLVIVGLDKGIDNAFGAQAEARVKVNEHQMWGEDDFAGI